MNLEDVRTLLAYNQWANRKLLDAARSLGSDEFTRDLRTSHASVRGTLVHIIGGEWKWLELWKGQSSKHINDRFASLWNPENFPTTTELEIDSRLLSDDQSAFIHGLSDGAIGASLVFENSRGRQELAVGQSMQHVVNHSSYHRGQVVTLLRQLNRNAPATDFHVFLFETHQALRSPTTAPNHG